MSVWKHEEDDVRVVVRDVQGRVMVSLGEGSGDDWREDGAYLSIQLRPEAARAMARWLDVYASWASCEREEQVCTRELYPCTKCETGCPACFGTGKALYAVGDFVVFDNQDRSLEPEGVLAKTAADLGKVFRVNGILDCPGSEFSDLYYVGIKSHLSCDDAVPHDTRLVFDINVRPASYYEVWYAVGLLTKIRGLHRTEWSNDLPRGPK